MDENTRMNQLEDLAKRSRKYLLEQESRESKEQLGLNRCKSQAPANVIGLPSKLALKNEGDNYWNVMEKLIMRDGRVYSLKSVLD